MNNPDWWARALGITGIASSFIMSFLAYMLNRKQYLDQKEQVLPMVFLFDNKVVRPQLGVGILLNCQNEVGLSQLHIVGMQNRSKPMLYVADLQLENDKRSSKCLLNKANPEALYVMPQIAPDTLRNHLTVNRYCVLRVFSSTNPKTPLVQQDVQGKLLNFADSLEEYYTRNNYDFHDASPEPKPIPFSFVADTMTRPPDVPGFS